MALAVRLSVSTPKIRLFAASIFSKRGRIGLSGRQDVAFRSHGHSEDNQDAAGPGHSAPAQPMRPDAGLVLAVVGIVIIIAVAVYVAIPL
jgi:hypothetical protein